MPRTPLLTVVTALTVAVLAGSAPLQAQSLTAPANPASARSVPSAATDRPIGPLVTRIGVRRDDVTPGRIQALQGSPARRDVAWMVLGGATLIVGSIVGGDGGTIIMITGGVIGLVGLWRYLQYS